MLRALCGKILSLSLGSQTASSQIMGYSLTVKLSEDTVVS